MKLNSEVVRNLEHQEYGEIRTLRCPACGDRSFRSAEQLLRHEDSCPARADLLRPDGKLS